ncbi:MAG: 2-hydroxyacyl-CoA dehydratase family protein [Kiritimatiellae bacterium]|nr:2-hydroxyacyl-CoA dehydratase family protein [Kiritimatiellia bacterium]
MNLAPKKITLTEWDERFIELQSAGINQPKYGGPLRRYLTDGDLRLEKLKFDNSPASLNLWNFLLTEEDRLHASRKEGRKIIGTMKDLGTVPVMAYSLPNVTAFYPDGAWWTPCVMEMSSGVLAVADSLGIDESFCPVRAMLGAFVTKAHFPDPDLIVCSVGATCDDFSAIAQRLNGLGYPILWWEILHRRKPERNEQSVKLPGGFECPVGQVEFVESELQRVKLAFESLAGMKIDDKRLCTGIKTANKVRQYLRELRQLTFTARFCPLPALELLIAEMLAIHFCSDQQESLDVLSGLLEEIRKRISAGVGFFDPDAVRIFWVNPVADLRVMNLLEDCGGRICGTDYLFCHALDEIPLDIHPMNALARMALADPMVGSTGDRAQRICNDIGLFGSEAVIVSRIPGASHCALEGAIIADEVRSKMRLPVLEIEVPPLADSILPSLNTRLTALVETVKERRKK